jgi:hypothetical protein
MVPQKWLPTLVAVAIHFAATFAFSSNASAVEVSPLSKRVLVLNSYDAAYGWTANIVAGVRSVFDPMRS